MDLTARIDWLRQFTVLGSLSDAALAAMGAAIAELPFQANRRLVLEDTAPAALYILYQGHLESYRTSPNTIAKVVGILPGAVLYLKELLLDQPAEQTTITLDAGVVWQVPRDRLRSIVQQYPEVGQLVSQQLAEALQEVEATLNFERERERALRPYLVPKVRRGIVGASRYAVRLRQDIRKATGDRQPVLIFGEPGLNKDNIAALIHFGSADRHEPLVKLNCNTLQANGADLFGRGNRSGILDWMGRGTLMLNNLEDLPPHLEDSLIQLLETGQYAPVPSNSDSRQNAALPSSDGDEPTGDEPTTNLKVSEARIIMTSEKIVPQVEKCQQARHSIKVPPLRVRKSDIAAQVEYYLSLTCRSRGIAKPKVTPEALRRLQSYDFPGNLTELENLVNRALLQADRAVELTEEVFWPASIKANRFRVNLLNTYPQLRQFLRSDWYPDRINYGLTLTAFALILGVLFLGPQSRDRNFALNIFWDWWWLGSCLIFPFLGRIWCSFCPFMIYGELVQKLSLQWWPRSLKPWPRQEAETVGGWFLFGLFTLILLWEELWNLENTAYLSACLLLLITAGAVIFSLLFERRFWCRYLCPIGGMNGLFAKLSMVELRAKQGICSAACTTYQCYKGGPQKGEGQETGGCPIYSHPAQLQDNKDCVLCMTCLKACPHRSVELNLRPPGIELWTTHQPSYAEVSLLFLLFGAVFLHRLPELQQRLQLDFHLDQFGFHLWASVLALSLPIAIAFTFHTLQKWLNLVGKTRRFLYVAYGYLPLVLGGTTAHYLKLGLAEAGQILPVAFSTFGLATVGVPGFSADPAVIEFLQGSVLVVGWLCSVILTQKIAKQPILKLWPQHAATIGLMALLWSVIVGW
ncbi:sigma 54-interacting transcriptional regulator [Alkalinema sp. FACHB-956]|uniref:sigma 54-interacting transcriptional regulator n=1 Tax=Alkalinema sp. FACHB-956 TaxID=2692768 RepID=UPI001682D80A|nr:sigma 54-interacting transcriptional regulator [Alkalinema sp. FACHB-956]MBD2326599.1 sigma 54-interacting transcriptional regulator [Alkalinema sp. FACHB-956]